MIPSDVPRTAVIQAKRGIGDVIWHLPFIRAIAAVSPGGRVTFLAPPSSQARDLLAAEPSIADIVYFEHHGSELRRAINFARLAALLRHRGFDKVWILDRTVRPASAAMFAGVRQRIGLGLGPQRLFITNRGIDRRHFHDQPTEWLVALMAAMNVPLASTEAQLHIPDRTLAAVGEKYRLHPPPWVVLGVGASHPEKDWPDDLWARFLVELRRATRGTIFLIGGPANFARADVLIAVSSDGAAAVNACDLALLEAAALLRHAAVFIGPNSAPMNLAAATATPAFGLFGSTVPLTYSKFIHPVVPDGGPSPDGMARISPRLVLDAVAPFLASRARQY